MVCSYAFSEYFTEQWNKCTEKLKNIGKKQEEMKHKNECLDMNGNRIVFVRATSSSGYYRTVKEN